MDMPLERYSRTEAASAGRTRLDEISEHISDAFDGSHLRLEVTYLLGSSFDADGEASISTCLATQRGRVYLVEDRFGGAWLVLHDAGRPTGTVCKCDDSTDARQLAARCCEFLARRGS